MMALRQDTKPKPILFNTEMVQAILEGRKTNTRRVVKFLEGQTGRLPDNEFVDGEPYLFYPGGIKHPQYHKGDIIYVRETWSKVGTSYFYKADGWNDIKHKWSPSIHMPKEAARIFLKVTGVRVERLKDIDIQGIKREGLTSMAVHCGDMEIAKSEFQILWDSTVKKSDIEQYGWEANPWVWVYEFELLEGTEGTT